MDKYCLTKADLNNLIDFCVMGQSFYDDEVLEFQARLQASQYWETELICLTYFLSHILENRQTHEIDISPIMQRLKALPEEIWISYQEFNHEFINYLFRSLRQEGLTLDENLVDIQVRLNEYKY